MSYPKWNVMNKMSEKYVWLTGVIIFMILGMMLPFYLMNIRVTLYDWVPVLLVGILLYIYFAYIISLDE